MDPTQTGKSLRGFEYERAKPQHNIDEKMTGKTSAFGSNSTKPVRAKREAHHDCSRLDERITRVYPPESRGIVRIVGRGREQK